MVVAVTGAIREGEGEEEGGTIAEGGSKQGGTEREQDKAIGRGRRDGVHHNTKENEYSIRKRTNNRTIPKKILLG